MWKSASAVQNIYICNTSVAPQSAELTMNTTETAYVMLTCYAPSTSPGSVLSTLDPGSVLSTLDPGSVLSTLAQGVYSPH